MDNIFITVFTASWNRGNELQTVLFESLKNQSYKNFEWVIVDDGSTDNTESIVKEMINKQELNITYYKQINQGKHIAINTGVNLSNGLLFYIVDSDDRLPKESLSIINKKAQSIMHNDSIAGVVGSKHLFSKQLVGSYNLPEDTICTQLEFRYKYKQTGDKAEVFKTNIIKEFPFPKFKNEKFIPESIVWNRIAQKYNMLYFNHNVYECDYLDEGLSNNSVRLRRNNPYGILNLYSELSKIKSIGYYYRVRTYINFWRFFFCAPKSIIKNLGLIKNQYLAFLFIPIGFLAYLKDSYKS